jgi:3-carboxy-cis,cis-muconate cycloisomerase
MRPSSSGSEADAAGGLFGPSFESAAVSATLSDAALLTAMLRAESALTTAAERTGRTPANAAALIRAACAAGDLDLDEIGRQAAGVANPVEPLVRALVGRVPEEAARYVHLGATSQDILDSATSLLARSAGELILDKLSALADACAGLADAHRDTLLSGRTLLQQALPTTFGLKAAGWLVAVDEAARVLRATVDRLAVQLGGAAGTLAALDRDGVSIAAEFAAELGLAEPVLPWHTDRTRIAALAGALGTAAGVLGKIALDVKLLAQTEVGEAREGGAPGRGGSSTMPHKHNPVDAVLVSAAVARTPGLVATVLAVMPQEHERAAGGWQAEWQALRQLLELVGGAAERTARLVGDLRVDQRRMRANLDATGGLPLAENVARTLTASLGRSRARQAVARVAAAADQDGVSLAEALRADPETAAALTPDQVADLLDPAGYLGSAGAFIDRALAAHQAAGRAAARRTCREIGSQPPAAGQSDDAAAEHRPAAGPGR